MISGSSSPFGEHSLLDASLQIFSIIAVLLPESFLRLCSFGERIERFSPAIIALYNMSNFYTRSKQFF